LIEQLGTAALQSTGNTELRCSGLFIENFWVGRDFVLVGDTSAIQMATCVADQIPVKLA